VSQLTTTVGVRDPLLRIAVGAALVAVFYGAGTYAIRNPTLVSAVQDALPTHRPRHPVLICNPWSGGGKVDKFALGDLASELGVETVMLAEGLDLEQLARDAVARGADALGMAGGDGSQALVASICVEHDLPYVCIPAGTRNHLALDLGLNRDDPRPAMHAFVDGIERRIDYAKAGDRFFVNNVSLGIYARIVQEDDYRDAKVETTLGKLPEMLGSQAEPFDLEFRLPDGGEVDGAYIIQVSNNPYDDTSLLRLGARPRLDAGELGVVALWSNPDVATAKLIAAAGAGRLDRTGAFAAFTAREFTVSSRSGMAFAGVDGEALELPTPLRFTMYPAGLRLLVPPETIATAHARAVGVVTLPKLWTVSTGREL
jgi:diacylglycerol kinase family enzyme